ncbi:hypothetical protein EBZ39_12365 [bacterium]|nr:hypothetical protein [bacterium]
MEVDVTRQVTDNFLPSDIANQIKKELLGNGFPWFYSSVTSSLQSTGRANDFKFHHVVCGTKERTSFSIESLKPLLNKLNPAAIMFCRIFMTTYTGENSNQGFHMDVPSDDEDNPIYQHMKTSIYYVNTNNGGTVFEDGQFVNSIENRLLTFDALTKHAAVTATDVSARVVININYF